jgi:ABC-type multidrug transport system fused ATPase/permease subunit
LTTENAYARQISYALLGNELTVPVVFSSLQLFNVIRAPLGFLPTIFSSLSEFLVASGRIKKFLLADEIADSVAIDQDAAYGVEVDGNFIWEAAEKVEAPDHTYLRLVLTLTKEHEPNEETLPNKEKRKLPLFKHEKSAEVAKIYTSEKTEAEDDETEAPFELRDLMLRVPKGSFVAIVGRVGSGKVSLVKPIFEWTAD